ncbi:hypothetical protein DDE01_06290 [Desulfovibrio desulfuricans]|nr:hypothetical protein DDE01_06290 [Desulfovibrio desulfuricans]
MCFSLTELYTARYAKGGRGELDPATGTPRFDCWGLVMATHRLFGVELPDFHHDPEQLLAIAREFRAQRERRIWVHLGSPVIPCIVALRHDARAVRAVNHFATYIGRGRFVHILNEAGVHTSTVTEAPYASRVAGYWSYDAVS